MEMKFCQSCGMPLSPEVLGTNADGSKSDEYCIYCYKDGAFTGDFTMDQMIEFCSKFVDEFNKNTGKSLTREEYKVELRKYFPTLKRWKSSDAELPHANSPMKQKYIEEVKAPKSCLLRSKPKRMKTATTNSIPSRRAVSLSRLSIRKRARCFWCRT